MWIKRVSSSGGIPDMREENRAEILQDAINLLDDELILETDELREEKSVKTIVERSSISKSESLNKEESVKIGKTWSRSEKSWRHITAVAAGITVFLIAGTVWNEVIVPNQPDQMESMVEESVEEDPLNRLDRGQDTDSVTNENEEEMDDLCALPAVEELEKEQSQMLQSQTQIHLPNQEVGSVAGVESLTGVQIPAMMVDLKQADDGIMADMLAFFIYDGRCYVQDEYYKERFSLVGDYVGTSVGLIDEWTTADGYVDYAGSVSGKFYEVKGYDPAFMLCMKYENGAVETFINNNGITLGKGSDLIEDSLHLSGNVEKVTYKTQKEWDTSLQDEKNHVLSEEYDALVELLLESFGANDFMYISDTPLDEDGTGRYHEDMDNYHITFHTKDGLCFDFVLYEDGYVRFQGFSSVCVQIEPSLYEEIVEVLKAEL